MKKYVGVFILFGLVLSFAFQAFAYDFGTTTLKNGSSGSAVMELQRFLNSNLNLGLVIDGKLGPKTIAVIKKWQQDNGLVADGLIGAKTKIKMNDMSVPENNSHEVLTGPFIDSSNYVAPTPLCNSNSAPSITITLPKAGDVYTVGQVVPITWTSCNVKNVYIGMANGGHDMGHFSSEAGIPATQGSYQWTVPNTTGTNFRIGIDDNASTQDISGVFTINSAITDDNLIKQTGCGVSFSKTSDWSVISNINNEIMLDIPSTGHTEFSGIDIKCVLGSSITDTDAKFGNITYFYDTNKKTWMETDNEEGEGITPHTTPVVATPVFTVNGWPVFHGTGRWLTYIVPISQSSILSLHEGDTEGGLTKSLTNLVKTLKQL